MASLDKFFLRSKTVLGLIVAAVPTVATFIDQASPFIPAPAQPYVVGVGLVTAFLGRLAAGGLTFFPTGK